MSNKGKVAKTTAALLAVGAIGAGSYYYSQNDDLNIEKSNSSVSTIENVTTDETTSVSDQYTEAITEPLLNGEATYEWDDGAKYVGMWENGKITGQGCFTTKEYQLEGTFFNGTLISGTSTVYSDGADIVFNIVEDAGSSTPIDVKITFKDGTEYTGNWNNGINGSGNVKFTNGDTYSGNFADGHFSEVGTYTWSDGAVYTGDWLSDCMEGKGIYYYSDDKNRYISGNFEANLPSGELTYMYKSHEYKTTWSNGECTSIVY